MLIPVAVVNEVAGTGFASLDPGPPPVAGYSVWLDASDQSTFTITNAMVSAWQDKSANNNDAEQSSAANRGFRSYLDGDNGLLPTLGINTTGSAARYAIAGVTGSSRVETGFVAGVHGGFDGGNRGTPIGPTTDGGRQIGVNTDGTLTIIKAGVSVILGSTLTVTTGTPWVIGWRLDSNLAELRLNSQTPQSNSDATTFDAGRNTNLGWKGTTGDPQPFIGHLFEIVIYSSTLSSGNAASVMTYLMNKWGVS